MVLRVGALCRVACSSGGSGTTGNVQNGLGRFDVTVIVQPGQASAIKFAVIADATTPTHCWRQMPRLIKLGLRIDIP